MSSFKKMIQNLLLLVSLTILSSCGGGGGNGNGGSTQNGGGSTTNEGGNGGSNNGGGGTTSGNSGVAGINGVITFEEFDNILDRHTGVVSFEVNNGIAKKGVKRASGKDPYRHPDGRISFNQGCGDGVTRVLIRTMNGVTTPVTPCGSDLTNIYGSPRYFEYSKISTDGTMIAAEVRHFNSNIDWVYTTFVYKLTGTKEIGKQVARFDGFAAPEWFDNRLLLLPMSGNTGIYVTDKNIQNLSRIDNEQISVFINNADVSPSGKHVIFEYNQQIWIMDMAGTKIEELIVGGSYLRFPTWSPDGRYIAYLLKGASLNDYHNEIHFYDVNTKKVVHRISTDDVFAPNSYGTHPDPIGPLSWINKP